MVELPDHASTSQARPDPGASSQHRHEQAHLRSCIVPENKWCSGFRWVLAVRAAQIHEAFCVFDLGSHRGARHDCLRNSCARDLGILSIVIVVIIMEKEIRFFCWLFLFHLRLMEECDVEVLVAPSFRCDAFPPLRKHAEPMRRFAVLRRRSSTTSSRHTDSAKNCMACFRGCWIEMCCRKSSRVLAGLVPFIAWRPPAMVVLVVVTTVEIVPMKRTPSILLRRRIHRVPNLRVMPRCAASVEDGLHQHGRTSPAEWE